MVKQYKLLLIKPKQDVNHYSTQLGIARLMGKRINSFPLALPLLAGLTPDHYDIKIVDEDMGPAPKRYKPDLVGITMFTSNSGRGYRLAKEYKAMGATVVLGGTFPSFNVEEGLQYADSIVVGEAEALWEQVTRDFEQGELKRIYQCNSPIPFVTNKKPRWDLVNTKQMLTISIQASRGCPFQCEFCLTTQLFGRKVRRRKVSDVVKEIKQLPLKNLFFVDENLTINKKYAKELAKALKPLNVSWLCQSSVDVADDPELLSLMAESGCRYIFIGFESLKNESLADSQKHQNNPAHYAKIIERIHQAGMHVYGSFIIGFDKDSPEDFKIFEQFVEQSLMPVFNLSILGTTKGMELYDRLEKENRLLPDLDKKFFVGAYPVIKYKNFDNRAFYDMFHNTIAHLYSYKEIRKRTISLLEKAHFRKEINNQGITVLKKMRITLILAYCHLITTDKEKRRFFFEVISLIRAKKVSISHAASLLLMFEAINRQIKNDKGQRKAYLSELDRIQEAEAKERDTH